jgi:hypothetical protein
MFEQVQLTKSENWITALHRNLQIACSASLAVWVVLYFIFPEIGSNDSYQASEIRNAILSALSLGYIAAAFALTFGRDSWIVERFPSWLNISVLGSALSIFFACVTADAMYFSSFKGKGVILIWDWCGVFISFFLGTILFSFYTIPFTLLIYYSSNLWRRLKTFFS